MIGPGADTETLQTIQRNDRFSGTRELVHQLDEVVESLSPADQEDVRFARDLSLSVHLRQQDRPDGTPYVDHPLNVTLNVAQKFGLTSKETLIAGLLHDSVEDQSDGIIKLLGGLPSDVQDRETEALRLIGERFGVRVSEMVGHLTNPNFKKMIAQAQMNGDQRSDDELMIHFYKEHFIEVMEQDPEAFLIKLADISENAFAIGKLADGSLKDWLRAKYGPVILATQERLAGIPAQGHILSVVKDSLGAELSEVYARDYAIAG